MEKKEQLKSWYVYRALRELCKNGDAYVTEDALYKYCRAQWRWLSYKTFKTDLADQIRFGTIRLEGSRIYTRETLRYEQSAARSLSAILREPPQRPETIPEALSVGGIALCEEQRSAVALALANPLSMILGGAGSGKSTLIRAIVDKIDTKYTVLCAPSGKAARNLTERTGLAARTVHSALGVQPNDDFLSPVVWSTTRLVIVDEVSMMSLGMLAGILNRVQHFCHVVLIGDPKQLLSVDSGNVLPDLLELGVPYARLEINHRQDAGARALFHNVVGFSQISRGEELCFDRSFALREMGEQAIQGALTAEAAARFRAGGSVQVLSPYNRGKAVSVLELNRIIRDAVNPLTPDKPVLSKRGRQGVGDSGETESFRDGDRVIICHNDRKKDCSNGDVGILHILKSDPGDPAFFVGLPDGRCPAWGHISGLDTLSLAYALTVHKAQGSQYDTVLMPISMEMYGMLSRNLLYTAISRAKKELILFGDMQALDVAVQKRLPQRKSMLVAKTRMLLEKCA